jgi:hypothetical protein
MIFSALILVVSGFWARYYLYRSKHNRKLKAAKELLFDVGRMLESLNDYSETGDVRKVTDLEGLNQEQFDDVYGSLVRGR